MKGKWSQSEGEAIKKNLLRLVNSCSGPELELLANAAENPSLKEMALGFLKSYS